MSFDFEATFESMVNSAHTELSEDSDKIRNQMKQILEDEKERLKFIAAIKLDPTATEAEFDLALENEKDVLKNAALAFEIQIRAAAQQAINAAINVLNAALNTAILKI
jgi:hypothetical protein